MFRIIFILIGAVILAGAAYWFLTHPGIVTLSWFGFEMQLPISLVIVGLVVIFMLLIFLRKIIMWIIFLPYRMSNRMKARQKVKAEQELMLLVRAVYAENIPEALKHMKRAKKVMAEDPFYLWFSAQTQGMADLHVEESKALVKLTEKAPFLALRGQVEAALRRNDSQSAREYLEKALGIDPDSGWALKCLFELYKQSKQYTEAEDTLDKLEDLKFFGKNTAKRELAKLYELMIDDVDLPEQEREEALRKAHYLDPSLNHVTEEFTELLLAKGHHSYAKSALEATWAESPTEKIGDLYVELHKPDSSVKAYELITKLVKNNRSDPQSQLLLGKYALKAKLWGDARTILEKLVKTSPSPQAYKLLSQLEVKENNNLKGAYEWAVKGCDACSD